MVQAACQLTSKKDKRERIAEFLSVKIFSAFVHSSGRRINCKNASKYFFISIYRFGFRRRQMSWQEERFNTGLIGLDRLKKSFYLRIISRGRTNERGPFDVWFLMCDCDYQTVCVSPQTARQPARPSKCAGKSKAHFRSHWRPCDDTCTRSPIANLIAQTPVWRVIRVSGAGPPFGAALEQSLAARAIQSSLRKF